MMPVPLLTSDPPLPRVMVAVVLVPLVIAENAEPPPPPQVSVLPSREGVQVHPEPAINGELEW